MATFDAWAWYEQAWPATSGLGMSKFAYRRYERAVLGFVNKPGRLVLRGGIHGPICLISHIGVPGNGT